MLDNKKFNIILSVLIAIGIWAYVIGETNPTDTKTYRDIPIQFLGEESLDENDLAILDVSAESLHVTVTGTRANVNRLRPGDITASVNLEEAAKGENQLRVNIRVPDNVEIEDKSLNKITVTVESKIEKEIDVLPQYEGIFSTDQEPITVELSRSKVTVTGAQSLVEQVHHASALVQEGEVTDKLKTIACRLEPVNKDGEVIERVKLSAGSVQVTAELGTAKTVPLKVPVVDLSDGTLEKSVSAPKTITIKGKSSVLESIESVTAEAIDLTDVTEDTTVKIVPVLPADVQVSGRSAESLTAEIKVEALSTRTFTFDIDEVDLLNLAADLQGNITETDRLVVVLTGKAEDLAAIEKEDIALQVNLKDQKEGSHQVALEVVCEKDCAKIEVTPKKVQVEIENKE